MKDNKNDIKDLLIFDSHCDTANLIYDQPSDFNNQKKAHLTLNKAKNGGLNAQIFALYVNTVYAPHQTLKRAVQLYNALEKTLFSTAQAVKVTSTMEMKSALDQNKLACWLSLENGQIIENSLDILEFFYHLGVRCMTLTHTKNTEWADSSADHPVHDGLTPQGKEIIQSMNKMGMVIDISHAADTTVEHVLEISSAPIMASHSCARSICNIPRNIPDTLISEISQRNGYIGVNFYPGFLNKQIYQQIMTNMKKYTPQLHMIEEKYKDNPDIINQKETQLYAKLVEGIESVNITEVIDHIVHIINVGGIDCVGLGSDFDGIPFTPINLDDVSCYPKLIDELINIGFNHQEIRKIMGLNLYNFFKQFDKQ